MKRTIIGFAILLFASLPAVGQESLATILERGYVAHWLVCGPFTADVEGGIAAAIGRGDAPLGDRDYMAAVGGIARLRPEHRQVVESGDDLGLWQRAGTTDATLDLSPFFTEKTEGVSYAAFYAEAATQTDVYFDLQTPLGARVWLNGFPEREIRAAPLAVSGVDRFVAALRAGKNLIVIETPGAAFETLADATGTTPRELGARAFSNRRLLTGKSGYEIALEVRPAAKVGELFYVPRLESTGAFGGSAAVVRQEAELIFFNPGRAPSPPVSVVLKAETSLDPILLSAPPIPPGKEFRLAAAVPIGRSAPGQTVPVTVSITVGAQTAEFQSGVLVREPAAAGSFYVVGGRWREGGAPGIHGEAAEAAIEAAARQTATAQAGPDYGFNLGEAALWDALIAARPDLVLPLQRLTQEGRTGTHAGYARPDHRLVSGEVIWRDMAWGLVAARERLGEYAPSAIHWARPGMAPQYPQILSLAGIPGVVSNLEVPGLHPLFGHRAPNGSVIWHRRKEASPGPNTLDELRQMAALQRRELLDLSIDSDLLINQNALAPPEPFLQGALARLAQGRPAIQFRGDGARRFFDDLETNTEAVRSGVPLGAGYWNATEPGGVIAQPHLKQAYTVTERAVATAETFATFAGLLGADYPAALLDHAWRALAYWAAPEILGVAESEAVYIDALAGLHGLSTTARAIRDDAAAYIAREADTLTGAPLATAGVQALVVFNPAARDRNAVCRATVTVAANGHFGIQDDTGAPVPLLVDAIHPVTTRGARTVDIRFVARAVPSLGYRSYFVVPTDAPIPAAVTGADTQIENDRFTLRVDTARGGIAALVDKSTGTDFAAAGTLNELALLREDPARTRAGRELWTQGESLSPSGTVDIQSEVSADTQRIRVSMPLDTGRVETVYTLNQDVPYVDCVLTISGIDHTDILTRLTFPPVAPGLSLVAGERYGFTTAARSKTQQAYQSDGRKNPGGAALVSAYGWSAAAPGDRIQVGASGALPLGRVAVVHGEDPMLRNAARELMAAFAARGIPAELIPDRPEAPDFLWSDTTAYASHDAMLDGGLSLRIVVGSPEQNAFARHIAEELPDAMAAEFSTRLRQGGSWLLDDNETPPAFPPTPTLLVAGLTAPRSAELARDVARAIRTLGYYSLPESAQAGKMPPPQPTQGLALLHPGPHLVSMGPDATMHLLLAHGGGPGPQKESISFHYALYPFSGDWRDADVPQMARDFAAPLFAVTSDLHSGSQPAAQAFLRATPPGLAITAVKAAGYPIAALTSEPQHPRDGLALRAFTAHGRAWNGTLALFVPWRNAAEATLAETPGVAVPVDAAGIQLSTPAFSIANLWAMPSSRHPLGLPAALGSDGVLPASVPTRYGREHLGPAPAGNLPLAIVLQGSLEGDTPQISVLVANRAQDKTLEGLAELQASEGWSAGPMRFYYRVAPGEFHRETISVARSGAAAGPGGLLAWTVQDDVTYRDVLLEAGAEVSLNVTRTGAQIKATVRNRSGLTAEGRVDLVTAPDLWAETARAGTLTASPYAQFVSVPPYAEQEYLFALSDADATPWAAVRLAAHGQAIHRPVPGL